MVSHWIEAFDAVRRRREEQDKAWAAARDALARLGGREVAVPKEFLLAMDRLTHTNLMNALGVRA
jgi:hypothetical protein